MQQEILTLLTSGDFEGAATLGGKLSAEDLANVLKELQDESLAPFCRALESDLLAEVLILLDKFLQEKIINSLHDDELEAVMEEISVDDTVDIIEEMPQEIVRRIAESEEILKLLEERNFAVLKPLLSSMNATDLAKVFEDTETDTQKLLLFRIMPKDLAAETFVEMDSDVQEKLIYKLNDKELKAVMD